jgi:putative tricarboxylic transport membrane protein
MFAQLIDNLGPALHMLMQWDSLVYSLIGMVIGIIAGAIPGVGASMTLALMFPFTYNMSVAAGVLFLLSIYSGAEYGGSISAILIRTPGTSAAVMTCIEGYPMAKQGLAHKALMISLVSGTYAGIFSAIVFILFAPTLAWIGLKFGPPEMFAVAIFGISIITSMTGKSFIRGFLAACIGFLLATPGIDPFSGYGRFTFNQPFMDDGIALVPAFVGFFAVAEALRMFEATGLEIFERFKKSGAVDKLTLKELNRLTPAILRGSIIGTAIGILPGAGAAISSFIAYNEEKRWSKAPEKFGTGVPEGIASPEAANNAVVAGALVPAMALGIPGSAGIAMVLGLLIIKGIVPGPLLFQESGPLVVLVFLGLIVINIYMLLTGVIGMKLYGRVADIPTKALGPSIMLLSLTGAYAYGGNYSDMWIAFVIGVFGWFLEKIEIPVIPLVLAFILEPLVEVNFIKTLLIHQGNYLVFFTRPISAVVLVLALALTVFGLWSEGRRGRKSKLEEDACHPSLI